MYRAVLLFAAMFFLSASKVAAQQRLRPQTDTLKPPVSLRILPQNFYNQHLGFFCRGELQLQKLTTLPVYFRLGSKAYVDYLERKPLALSPVAAGQ